jgi:hypothetical protein
MRKEPSPPNVDGFHLDAILTKALPNLLKMRPRDTLNLLADRLEFAISAELAESLQPHSILWRTSISNLPSYARTRTTYDVLVSQLRDALAIVLTVDPSDAAALLGLLLQRKANIYQRILLDVLTSHDVDMHDRIVNTLRDPVSMSNADLGVERWLFANKHLTLLDERERSLVLAYLIGPRDDIGDHALHKRRDALFTIERHLSAEQRVEVTDLTKRFGAPTDLSIANWPHALAFGPESPLPTDYLESLSIPLLIAEINSWRPTSNEQDPFFAPSPEGLGRLLRQRVAKEPEKFLEDLSLLEALEPTYIRNIVAGLQDALRIGHPYDIAPALQFAKWASGHPNVSYTPLGFLGRDIDWTWTRQGVAHFVLDVLTHGRTRLSLELNTALWVIITNLMSIEEPPAEVGSGSSFANMALNTVRGTTLHAVMEFARWLYVSTFGDGAVPDDRHVFETLMPDVRMVLDSCLDDSVERSPISLAVYGQFFTFLLAIDHHWARSRAAAIFGVDPYDKIETRAAWDTYLTFCTPNLRSIEVLESQYVASIRRLIELPPEAIPQPQDDLNPIVRAVDHIFQSAIFGDRRLAYPHRLLQSVLEVAAPQVKAHLMRYAGQLCREGTELEVIAKLQIYVESRLTTAESSTSPKSFATELSNLGNWYLHPGPPLEWLLDQTIRVLRITSHIDGAYGLIEVLRDVDISLIPKTLTILELVTANTADSWVVLGSHDTIYNILQSARDAVPATLPQVHRIASYMIQRGWREFHDL